MSSDASGENLGHELSLWVVLYHDAVATHLGVNTTEHKVLDCIARQPGLSPTQLVQLTGLSHPAITKVVNRLSELGYVQRDRDATDGRKFSLTVTAAHASATAGMNQPMIDEMNDLVSSFEDAEREAIGRWLIGTIEVMRTATIAMSKR